MEKVVATPAGLLQAVGALMATVPSGDALARSKPAADGERSLLALSPELRAPVSSRRSASRPDPRQTNAGRGPQEAEDVHVRGSSPLILTHKKKKKAHEKELAGIAKQSRV